MSIEEQLAEIRAAVREILQRMEPPTRGELPLVLTKARAAKALGVSKSTLERMIKSGKLLPVQMNRNKGITAAEIRRYLNQPEPTLAPPSSAPRTRKLRRTSESERLRAALRKKRT